MFLYYTGNEYASTQKEIELCMTSTTEFIAVEPCLMDLPKHVFDINNPVTCPGMFRATE